VGALTAIILFLIIIVVVLVVCKTRIFVCKTPEILETLPASERKQSAKFRGEKYLEKQEKVNFRFIEDNRHTSNIENILPNRSPLVCDRVKKIHGMPSKMYENVEL